MSNAPADRLSFVPRDLRSGTTYARARLRLGIASVGTLVVLSAGRPVVAEGFSRTWARGAAVHGFCLLVVALVLLGAGRAGGDGAALAVALVLMVVLLSAQARLAGLVGGVRRDGDGLSASDPSFVGGIVGLPGRGRMLLSAAWDDETDRVQVVRREALRRSGARTFGVVAAALFDLLGLAVVLFATSASATSVAGIATVSLWMTVWSFLGLLVLPSLSRRAVLAADRSAVSRGIDPGDLTAVLRRLDAEQEDEPRRGRLVETVFHPVPSLEGRVARLTVGQGPELPQPWNTARAALFLSWASIGLLSRAVHCNCGRPALWVLFPGD